jgi:hypothetical protein
MNKFRNTESYLISNKYYFLNQQHFDYFLSFLVLEGCYNFILFPIPPLTVFLFLFKIRSIN